MQVILKQIGDCILIRCDIGDIIPLMDINLSTFPEDESEYFYERVLEELPELFIVAVISVKVIEYKM